MNPLLLELQNADSLLIKLKREKSRLDDGTAARAARDELQIAADALQGQIDALAKQRSDREEELKTAEAKIARQQDRLMNAKSPHEVDSLQRDISALSKARGDLDEAVLLVMDEGETALARHHELEAQRHQANARLIEIEGHFGLETARLSGEITSTQVQREQLAAQLDAPSRLKYDDFAARLGGVAVAHPENGNCSACGMTITPFALRSAKTEAWPTCESCGRLLFVA